MILSTRKNLHALQKRFHQFHRKARPFYPTAMDLFLLQKRGRRDTACLAVAANDHMLAQKGLLFNLFSNRALKRLTGL